MRGKSIWNIWPRIKWGTNWANLNWTSLMGLNLWCTVSFVNYVYSHISKNISPEKIAKNKQQTIQWSYYKMLGRENHLIVNKWLKRWLHVISWRDKMRLATFVTMLEFKIHKMALSENWGHFPSVETFISILLCPHPFYLFYTH